MAKTRLLTQLKLMLFLSQTVFSSAVYAFNGFGYAIDSYIREGSQRYQVSEAMLRGLVKFEDGWQGKVSPTGATGVGQFTRKTWNWLASTPEGRSIGMQYITAKNQGTIADPRRNNRVNTLATALYARWHITQFQERGITVSDESLYLAHNIGLDGFHRAIQGRATIDDIRNMRHNGMKKGMSVRDFLRYQADRYNESKAIANFQRPVKSMTSAQYVKAQSASVTRNKAAHTTFAPVTNSMQVSVSPTKWVEPLDGSVVQWVSPN